MIEAHLLMRIPLLSQVPEAELQQLGTLLRERKVTKGSYIVYAQDPGPSIMFVHEGRVKINLLSDDGKEVVLANLGEGEFFGELAVLTGEERSANVVAVTDVKLLVLDAEDFNRHVLSHSGLAMAMLKELAVRLRASTAKIGDLALYDVYRRVARTLKSLGISEIKEGREVSIIADRPTHQELAAMVGTSREMVTRALKGLEEDGCIIIDGKRIEVRKLPL